MAAWGDVYVAPGYPEVESDVIARRIQEADQAVMEETRVLAHG